MSALEMLLPAWLVNAVNEWRIRRYIRLLAKVRR